MACRFTPKFAFLSPINLHSVPLRSTTYAGADWSTAPPNHPDPCTRVTMSPITLHSRQTLFAGPRSPRDCRCTRMGVVVEQGSNQPTILLEPGATRTREFSDRFSLMERGELVWKLVPRFERVVRDLPPSQVAIRWISFVPVRVIPERSRLVDRQDEALDG